MGRKRHHRQPLHRSQRPAHQKSSSGADRLLNIAFRVYDDGIAFRYIFPAQGSDSLVITDEYSQFAMPSDLTAWWIPGDYDTQEYEYNRSRLSEIRSINEGTDKLGNVSQTGFSPQACRLHSCSREATRST